LEDFDFQKLANGIKHHRELRKLSVRELSDLAEIDYPYLTNIEAGTKNPSAENLIKILNALLINVCGCLSTSNHEDSKNFYLRKFKLIAKNLSDEELTFIDNVIDRLSNLEENDYIGESLTSAKSFTKSRRCAISGSLYIKQKNDYKLIGKRLNFYRVKSGFSQRELAEKSGVSQSYIAELENGKSQYKQINTLNKLAVCLGISLDDLFFENLEVNNDVIEDGNVLVSQLISKLSMLSFDKIKCIYGITTDFANYKCKDSEQKKQE